MAATEYFGKATTDCMKLLMCDLDGTLIQTRSGAKFPKYAADWKFIDGVQENLIKYHKEGWSIVIISNQGGKNKTLISKKMASVYNTLKGLDVQIYIAHKYDHYRKPETGIFDEFILAQVSQHAKILWVGDAMGREGDFSDSDLKFGENLQAKYPKLDIEIHNEEFLQKK